MDGKTRKMKHKLADGMTKLRPEDATYKQISTKKKKIGIYK